MNTCGFSDRRIGPRIRVGLPLRLRFGWRDSGDVKASMVDISERGLRVREHAPLRFGTEVKVIPESTPDDAKVYRVVWMRQAESSAPRYDIGLELKL